MRSDTGGASRPGVGDTGSIDLYWIPLGAGGRVVRVTGQLYEAIAARAERRPPRALYHSALEVRLPEGRYVIEMAPGPDVSAVRRHAVVEGPVGMRWLGRFRLFRYEVRCERGAAIPDADLADGVVRISERLDVGRRLVGLVATLPALVWGRDDSEVGDMWSSNSVTSWLLTSAGLDTTAFAPPAGGRAPGWDAGRLVARSHRSEASANALPELAGPQHGAGKGG